MIPGVVAANTAVAKPANPASEILTALLSWWDFEEADGATTYVDARGYFNLPAFSSPTTQASGKVGRSLEYAARARLDSTTDARFRYGDESFTLFCWYQRETAESAGTLFGRENPSANYSYAIQVTAAGLAQFVISPSGSTTGLTTVSSAPADDVAWHFVAAGYDAERDVAFIILDGARVESPHTGGAYAGVIARFGINARYSSGSTSSNVCETRVDSAGVMGAAISDAQYATLYNAGAGLNYASLLALAA